MRAHILIHWYIPFLLQRKWGWPLSLLMQSKVCGKRSHIIAVSILPPPKHNGYNGGRPWLIQTYMGFTQVQRVKTNTVLKIWSNRRAYSNENNDSSVMCERACCKCRKIKLDSKLTIIPCAMHSLRLKNNNNKNTQTAALKALFNFTSSWKAISSSNEKPWIAYFGSCSRYNTSPVVSLRRYPALWCLTGIRSHISTECRPGSWLARH